MSRSIRAKVLLAALVCLSACGGSKKDGAGITVTSTVYGSKPLAVTTGGACGKLKNYNGSPFGIGLIL